MFPPAQLHFSAWRTRELRELLEDEDKINHVVRSSEKFQRLQHAAEKILISNQKLAKVSLSQKPRFRDAKLLLAMKYKELEKLRSIIQAKQEQLAEKYSVHYAHWCLTNKISHAEVESELLFQRFTEGKTSMPDFLESFLSVQKLHHIRLVLVKKLQEIIRHKQRTAQRLSEVQPEAQYFSLGLPEQIGLSSAVVLPPFLLPLDAHINTAPYLQPSLFCSDENELLQIGVHGRGLKRPARPVRLQPLNTQQRHQQAPQ
ncbi:vacuolar protein sorting-associated protein 37D-like [Archocentrus centrarchus]|uniref:vacuolar protein sorting-associated protein 37D-like n=1 Tax=Archocentrus centrarchus TaxID=63155 RepID=UPI0011EA487B|nr:vacuolar protein sorting-associated protein 37D-like [Archocentrus centrarchus]